MVKQFTLPPPLPAPANDTDSEDDSDDQGGDESMQQWKRQIGAPRSSRSDEVLDREVEPFLDHNITIRLTDAETTLSVRELLQRYTDPDWKELVIRFFTDRKRLPNHFEDDEDPALNAGPGSNVQPASDMFNFGPTSTAFTSAAAASATRSTKKPALSSRKKSVSFANNQAAIAGPRSSKKSTNASGQKVGFDCPVPDCTSPLGRDKARRTDVIDHLAKYHEVPFPDWTRKHGGNESKKNAEKAKVLREWFEIQGLEYDGSFFDD